jgi:hypothetical protein
VKTVLKPSAVALFGFTFKPVTGKTLTTRDSGGRQLQNALLLPPPGFR